MLQHLITIKLGQLKLRDMASSPTFHGTKFVTY